MLQLLKASTGLEVGTLAMKDQPAPHLYLMLCFDTSEENSQLNIVNSETKCTYIK